MKTPPLKAALLLLAILLLPRMASAHMAGGETGGFLSGMHHPISGWDHILAMVAVGLWGAQLGKPANWMLPVTFPLVMAFGGFLGLIGVPIPAVEFGIALSAIILGFMVFSENRPQLWLAAVIVGIFAIYHGHAHGTELPPGESGLLYSAGFVIATGCLHGVGIALGLAHRWTNGRAAIRWAGAVIAVGGVYFLFQAIG